MKSKGYTILELLVVLGAIGVAYFIIISSTSYAFNDHSDEYYTNLVNMILTQAKEYGKTSEELKTEGSLLISVDDLIDKQLIMPDENGELIDPRNEKDKLNDMKIILKYDTNNEIVATIEE